MSRKRDLPPALILRNPTELENVPKFNVIDSPLFLIGRSFDAHLIILQKCISRKHCSITQDEKTNTWTITSHVKNSKGVSVDGRDVKLDESVNLKCGVMINVTPYFAFEFKCSPDEDHKCCDERKKARLVNDIEYVDFTKIPDSSNDMDEFYRAAKPSCSNAIISTSVKELPDSHSNLDDTIDFEQTEEIQKLKEKTNWAESRIKFLELKIKEKEKREVELESVKDEKEVLETENRNLKEKVAELEAIELEYRTNVERFRYRDEEERTKDALERKINELESALKNQQDENSQLLTSICSTADDMAKIKEENQELQEKLKEKFAFSVNSVPAIGNTTNSPINSSANPTMPYDIIRNLLKSTPLITDDGMTLRRLIVDHGAIHAILACLAIYSHQTTDSRNQTPQPVAAVPQNSTSGKKIRKKNWAPTAARTGHYWAKGTGYGTGAMNATWNVDEALSRQRVEEQHVIVLLQILSNYINPDYKVQNRPSVLLSEMCSPDAAADLPLLPAQFVELIEESCLVAVLASYLRNDSVLDMARHIPVYRAVMALLRAMTLDSQLVKFVLPPEFCSAAGAEALLNLLKKMKLCVDTYSSTIKKTNINDVQSTSFASYQDLSNLASRQNDDEELNGLIVDIQDTTTIVEIIVSKVISNSNSTTIQQPQKPLTSASIEEVYIRVMKKLQIGSYDIIAEDDSGLKFTVAYHYERFIREDTGRNNPARMKRLVMESTTLISGLPCSFSSTVFVCTDPARLDMMKVLIIGPAETPYANGCFEFDIYFPPEYPDVPMKINLATTGRNKVRFNPNLYNDGKVCLSILNTWHGRPEEKWIPKTTTLLQVLVSIQSLILVPDPYFNEPGYEKSRGTPGGDQNSRSYNDGILNATVQYAMLEQIRNPCPCFKDIIHAHFFMKRQEIEETLKKYIAENGRKSTSHYPNMPTLKNNFRLLQKEFMKLKCPEGVEEHEKSIFKYVPKIEQPEPQPMASTSSANAYHGYHVMQPQPSTSTYTPPTVNYNTYSNYTPYTMPFPQAQPQPPSSANFNYQNWPSLFNIWPGGSAGSSTNITPPQPGSSGGLFNFF